MKRKTNTGVRLNEQATFFFHPVHDDEQQQQATALQLQQQQDINTEQQRQKYVSGIYKYVPYSYVVQRCRV